MSGTALQMPVAEVMAPLLEKSRYKGAYGGRGSLKSHFFAELGVERSILDRGLRMVCIREVQKSLKESAKRLIEDKIKRFELESSFVMNKESIATPGGGIIMFQGMTDHTAESIKSLEGFDIAWVEEAQTLSARSLEYLRPTIRKEGSELWFSWNPRDRNDPVDQLFRGMSPPKDSIIVNPTYKDNPWFPQVMEEERSYDELYNRERYAHVWLGDYEPAAIGAIWNRQMFHRNRVESAPDIGRIVVAIDVSVTDNSNSDEHGIVVCGIGDDKRGYVLDDLSTHGEPMKWARRAVAAYDKWEADAIVIEVNQGGDMIRNTINSIRPNMPIIEVRATKGKHVRAEPISSLYDLDRISHVGTFTQLEDQLCMMTPAGYEGKGSPDRADALIWAFSQLFPSLVSKPEKKRGPLSVPNLKRF